MASDDPNLRPTVPRAARVVLPTDGTRPFADADPWSTAGYTPQAPPLADPVADWPPSLTRYTPRSLLGRGGMGEVYLAHDGQLDRQVAIKFARFDRQAVDRILAEARAAARLRHAGICPVFDADVCDGVPYLIMAYVPGVSLAAELGRLGRCPPDEAARLVRAVAAAMQFAHEHGVIHRDLKPANILLTAAQEPIVTDFGLAVRRDIERVADGVIAGTPYYMAPEQADGNAAAVGKRTDVYALGVILFELLTGHVPFGGAAREVLEKVREKRVPPVDRLAPEVPPHLVQAVARATARHPADRFQSMAAFAAALDLPRPAPPKPSRWRRVAWLAMVPVALVFGVVLTVCGFIVTNSRFEVGPTTKTAIGPNPPAGLTPDETNRSQAGALTRDGEKLEAAGEADKAVAKYTAAITLDPRHYHGRQERAELYEKRGQYVEALGDYTALTEHDPKHWHYWMRRGEVQLKLNRVREGIDDFTTAIRLNPREAKPYTLRADAWVRMKDPAKALADLDEAVKIAPWDTNIFRRRAQVRERAGDAAGAKADADKVRELEEAARKRSDPPKKESRNTP